MRQHSDIAVSTPGYALQFSFVPMSTFWGDAQEIHMSSRAPWVIACLSHCSDKDNSVQYDMVCGEIAAKEEEESLQRQVSKVS